MKKFNKIISLLLTVVMLLGSLSALMTVNVFGAEQTDDDATQKLPTTPLNTNKSKEDYTEKIYKTEDEKIASMRLALTSNGFQIYVDDFSGEVAVVNTKTDEKLFTNPWDVASDKSSNLTTDDSTTGSIKEQLLSQIELEFTDLTNERHQYSSFRMAAMRDQIVVKNIKNGVRVEYTIGRQQAKMLVPHYIEASRFEKFIWNPVRESLETIDNFTYQKFLVYFEPQSIYKFTRDNQTGEVIFELDENGNKVLKGDGERKELTNTFPALKTIDLMYTLPDSDNISASELSYLEEIIRTYCPEYTYEELDYDHEMTKYEAEDENPPVFKMALEYTIDENGLSVRLPANGIRFNESLYTLTSLTVLPYMGAGNNWNEGYNFMPDGSGALYEFDSWDVSKSPTSVYNQVYGTDYAYHELSGTYEKTIRYPVFGTVETTTTNRYTYENYKNGQLVEEIIDVEGSIVEKYMMDANNVNNKRYPQLSDLSISSWESSEKEVIEVKRGFIAIIEEGDALTKISSYHGGNQSDYNSVKMQFTPRPSDSYNLQESISVSGVGVWTVVSERKYLGNYKIRYIMLSDGDKAAEEDVQVYDASWLGMAVAYRDYLTREGILSPLSADQLSDDIPLYIESFGTMETIERILSIPVNRMTALTTFENVKTMYEELSGGVKDSNGNVVYPGITNINFKLTGFANGGMYSTVPGKLKFEKSVGGNKGFQALLDYAAEVSKEDNSKLGIFPDFDFAYITSEAAFDGLSLRKHAAKTIDDRYASKRVYSATQQKYINYYDLVVSPAYFSEFYEKLTENYLKFNNLNGISVSTLGNALNSDFDEDEPYNREDAKSFTVKAFEYLDSSDAFGDIDIMTSGGNAYTWKYVDHILDVALDSSRQSRASAAVPFIGVVLHGSMQFAGEPLNMEGDIQYAMLKAIENGASPYFVLSYQNTQNLKEDEYLSKYYSIRYDIWKDDLYSTYTTLNNVLGDLQDKYIINHEGISGERVPDVDEIEADILESLKQYIELEDNKLEYAEKELALALSNARKEGLAAEAYVIDSILETVKLYNGMLDSYNKLYVTGVEYEEAYNAFKELESVLKYREYSKSQDETEKALYQQYQTASKKVSYILNGYSYEEVVRLNSVLEAATATLNFAKLSYNYTKQLSDNVSAMETEYNKTLASFDADAEVLAKKTHTSAKNEYNQIVGWFEKGTLATVQYNLANSAFKTIEPEYQTAEAVYTKALADLAAGSISANEFAVIEAAYNSVKAEYDEAKATLEKVDAENKAGTLAQTAMDEAQAKFDAIDEAYNNGTLAQTTLDDAKKAWDDAKAAYDSFVAECNPAELDVLKAGYDAAIAAEAQASSEYNTYKSAAESKKTTSGYIDLLVVAKAYCDATKGYDKYENSEDMYEKEFYLNYVDANKRFSTAEKNVFNTMLTLAGSNYKSFKTIVKKVEAYVKSTQDAIVVVASKTGNTSILNADKTALNCNIMDIDLDDLNYMTKEAVMHARTVYNYFYVGRYSIVVPNALQPVLDSEGNVTENSKFISSEITDTTFYGAPVYLCKYQTGEYVYVVGCDEIGYYELVNGTLGRKISNGNNKTRVENADPIMQDGVAIYKDADGYFAKHVTNAGMVIYSAYEYQEGYNTIFNEITGYVEDMKACAIDNGMAASRFEDSRFDSDITVEDEKNEESKNEESVSKYIVDNITVVTYGVDDEAYKYIILNYNNFSVNVEYNGITYVIAAYDFVDVKVQN